MAELVLGPLLRYVDATSATVWVETDKPCTVEVGGAKAETFSVQGNHYALVIIEEMTGPMEYTVQLDGETVWPLPDSPFPPSVIRPHDQGPFRLMFGSCRKPDSDDPKEQRAAGPDALAAYALRLADGAEPPDALLLLGDQVYADETSKATAEWISAHRDLDQEPGKQVANFAEYVHLYREAWRSPAVRWLLSTVPSSMIFDDHDLHDDWNTSAAWRDDANRTSWWAERERGGLIAYWIYQHIGNLSPAELAEDPTFRAVTAATGDTASVLSKFADGAIEEIEGRKGTRWSYRRDFGPVRFLAIDTRCGRILNEPRGMVSDDEFTWLEENAEGDYEHLLIGSSLPWLMPHAISHVQSMNEAACRKPGWRGRLAEKLRRAADLEHWPAFRASSDRLSRLIHRAATSGASVCVLSGDVHHLYVAEATFPEPVPAKVFQLTCSPIHNHEKLMRPLFAMAWWKPLARLLRWWMLRSPEIDPLPVDWEKIKGPYFGNTIATLTIDGKRATLVLDQAKGDLAKPHLEPLPEIRLT
ncbi:alkaline phosphatase D family protein [Actinokineospora guangxiensis]|uniref:Alkaline phosphatase D family protein n=1 Tax=Actinokineospora guangxiensis TaxID=1490288 RepID=A0ABW0EQ61_9PSEU